MYLICIKKENNRIKKILKINGCKVGGKKEELINRIIINKNKFQNWLEN